MALPKRNWRISYYRSVASILLLAFLFLSFSLSAQAQDASELDLGAEYSDYNKEKYSGKSNKSSSGEKAKDRSIIVSSLLFIPNRVMDLLDILRFDVGVGPALGLVARVTPHGQAGVRVMMPISVRAGLRGRKLPIFIEHTNEMGVGPLFLGSKEREPSPLEVGVGADLFLAGVYAGISIDSIFDFFGGFVGLDISEDDF